MAAASPTVICVGFKKKRKKRLKVLLLFDGFTLEKQCPIHSDSETDLYMELTITNFGC